MLAKVQKWGNSQGIRIPKKILNNTHIQVGEEVNITVHVGKIIVEPSNRIRGRYDINALAGKMPKEYKPGEENWGFPAGKEVW